MPFFKTNKRAMEPAMQVHAWVPGRLSEVTESHFGPLHTAAFWGLSLFTQTILPGNKYLNSNDWMYCRAPLSYAAERGHEAVVKLLLDTEGIDVKEYLWTDATLLCNREGRRSCCKALTCY
jgi:hypothetical protein